MRKSKSNPAKYARNYRKISQRHMSGGAGADEERSDDAKERQRLDAILRQSERTWRRGLRESGRGAADDGDGRGDGDGDGRGDDGDDGDGALSLLSPALREQLSGAGGGDAPVVLPGTRKKKQQKPRSAAPPPTPEEVRAAKARYKSARRKLGQLEERRRRKEARAGLYRQLEENALLKRTRPAGGEGDGGGGDGGGGEGDAAPRAVDAREARGLLLKSSERGKRTTKKQRLERLRRKEALGIRLTEEEMEVLYVTYDAPSEGSFPGPEPGGATPAGGGGAGNRGSETTGSPEGAGLETTKQKKKKKKKKKKKRGSGEGNGGGEGEGGTGATERATKKSRSEGPAAASALSPDGASAPTTEADAQEDSNDAAEAAATPASTENASAETSAKDAPKPDYSQMMFAGLSSLKTKTDARNAELAKEEARRRRREEEKAAELEEEERKKRRAYVPEEIGEISTVRRGPEPGEDAESSEGGGSQTRNVMVQAVDRPASIEKSRYDLPVSRMEYEIVDAVRSRDCTILCGETGSGKSTQVPQFLYEAGFAAHGWFRRLRGGGDGPTADAAGGDGGDDDGGGGGHLLIGVTQPRRVAAVSTAKRVAHEMGSGDGRSVPPNGLVAYQTRYETAGLGPGGGAAAGSRTRVKFMTDGILLQEIRDDLLLRKYGAVVVDEAHERNLNTDVLLGLLSVALPLRRKATEESEGRLPPLKLVIMSATLRVEDFTENERLFPEGGPRPALVKVPGRTHPVSIHHSKVTELDNYERVAMEKVCKIHRKLPPGGILVFLTGKQEILRCTNRLKQRLEPGRGKGRSAGGKERSFDGEDASQTKSEDHAPNDDSYFRDMDDDEVDGDLFQKMEEGEEDDFDSFENNEDLEIDASITVGDDDNRPKKVRILPLYSMLSAEEQAEVFAPVPEDTRLIVIATNIAETSITIPGISYVVDSGRQKCRNYHAGTGVASYDVMWISKAAADQRAGRAGRTGPGHCYRLYSSSVYSRHLDEFALPEVLTRPLEDVVLAMKAMDISDVTRFPFPTPPGRDQVAAAVRLLANLGCVDVSRAEELGGDGKVTPLGSAVANLPLGVRYGKILLVAAQAGVLDYAIVLVAALSESPPFVHDKTEESQKDESGSAELKGLDEVDRNQSLKKVNERKQNEKMKSRWHHDGGDVLSALKAVGAYAYAGRGAGGNSEKLACRRFCEANGLNLVVMQRIAKMRLHLCKLAKTRLPAGGNSVATTTGKYINTMPPPKRLQECLLRQAIASGLLDNIARRALPGSMLPAEFTGVPRSAYICANPRLKEPLFIDNRSSVHSARPEWVCFDSIVRKPRKDGTTVATMQRVTPVDPEWLAAVCAGSNLMKLGSSPLAVPLPRYLIEKDVIQCAVDTKFGGHGWEIPPCYVGMRETIGRNGVGGGSKKSPSDDSFRWFARYLLEGKVLHELTDLPDMLNDEPSIITKRDRPMEKKAMVFVSALSEAGVDSAAALLRHWGDENDKFLFRALKPWVKRDRVEDAKRLWMTTVTSNIEGWKHRE